MWIETFRYWRSIVRTVQEKLTGVSCVISSGYFVCLFNRNRFSCYQITTRHHWSFIDIRQTDLVKIFLIWALTSDRIYLDTKLRVILTSKVRQGKQVAGRQNGELTSPKYLVPVIFEITLFSNRNFDWLRVFFKRRA